MGAARAKATDGRAKARQSPTILAASSWAWPRGAASKQVRTKPRLQVPSKRRGKFLETKLITTSQISMCSIQSALAGAQKQQGGTSSWKRREVLIALNAMRRSG